MAPKRSNDSYGAEETQARVLAALRGARHAGPKPKASMMPKRPKVQRKRGSKGHASAST